MYMDKAYRLAKCSERNTFQSGNIRIQFLTNRLVRLEWQENSRFEDHQTLAVVNRDLGPVKFSCKKSNGRITLKTSGLSLELTDDQKPFSRNTMKIAFTMNGKKVTWRPGQSDEGNLGGTIRTLDTIFSDRKMQQDKVEGLPENTKLYSLQPVDLGNGFISRDGWSLIDDSRNIVLDQIDGKKWVTPRPEGKRQDWYFLAYGHDYRGALADVANVFGSQPLPPRYTLGYWWSRFWAYSDTEIEGLMKSFDRMDIPFDVMVIDMDWHKEGWTGYSWDKRYFPDPDEHLAWLHKHGVKVTLNLHPADGVAKFEDQFSDMCKVMGLDPKKVDNVPFDITDPKYMEHYFKILHHPDEKRGVDFWWMDWQQGESTKMSGLDTLPWINQLHWEDMEDRPDRKGKRPLIFSRFGGFGAGRYVIGFSGDTHSKWESLAFQPYFTATAANVLYGYWSHDIGGHMPGVIEPELYTRWIQFGIYSPILRTHTTKNADAERRVWEYPAPYNEIMMETIRQRYSMVPYIYSENRKAFDTGVSLCRPMYYDYPEVNEAYKCKNQYKFGESMIVAPIITHSDPADEMSESTVWLPKGEWFDTARGCLEKGGKTITRRYMLNETPVFVKPGTVIPGQSANVRRLNEKYYRHLEMTIYPGESGSYDLYEDDGISTEYLKNKFAVISMSHETNGKTKTIRVAKTRGHFEGYIPERTLEIRIEGSVPPASVHVGKKALDYVYRLDEAKEGFSYNGLTATTIIKIASLNLDKGLEVKVAYDAAVDFRSANGLRGAFNRLARVNDLVNVLTANLFMHPDRRLVQDTFCIANRISRWPETFDDEIKLLKKNLARLPKVISELSQTSYECAYTDMFQKNIDQGRLAVRILEQISL
jgi:alpha-glucosidase